MQTQLHALNSIYHKIKDCFSRPAKKCFPSENMFLSIYDALGKRIARMHPEKTGISINTYGGGLYFYHLSNEKNVIGSGRFFIH